MEKNTTMWNISPYIIPGIKRRRISLNDVKIAVERYYNVDITANTRNRKVVKARYVYFHIYGISALNNEIKLSRRFKNYSNIEKEINEITSKLIENERIRIFKEIDNRGLQEKTPRRAGACYPCEYFQQLAS